MENVCVSRASWLGLEGRMEGEQQCSPVAGVPMRRGGIACLLVRNFRERVTLVVFAVVVNN